MLVTHLWSAQPLLASSDLLPGSHSLPHMLAVLRAGHMAGPRPLYGDTLGRRQATDLRPGYRSHFQKPRGEWARKPTVLGDTPHHSGFSFAPCLEVEHLGGPEQRGPPPLFA